ncbi:MAG TPA: hypothetical protein DEB60_00730 [Brevundimonas sp.]|nr:hypothetical protein [Brevundimonas sp.]
MKPLRPHSDFVGRHLLEMQAAHRRFRQSRSGRAGMTAPTTPTKEKVIDAGPAGKAMALHADEIIMATTAAPKEQRPSERV